MKTILIAAIIILIAYSLLRVVVYALLHLYRAKTNTHDKTTDNPLDMGVVGPALRKAETGANDYPFNSWAEYYEEEAITKVKS